MKSWIFLVALILGSLSYEVRCDSGSGDSTFEDDEDDLELNDAEHEQVGEDNDDYDTTYGIDCDDFNMELCLYFFGKDDNSFFSETSKDDDACWESYATAECLKTFAAECLPDDKMKENLLCKLNNFKDRIAFICLNESYVMEEEEEPSDEEVLQCLEGVEIITEECVEETIPRISEIIEENKDKIDLTNAEAAKIHIQCLVTSKLMECVVNRLEDRCPAEVLEGFVEGAEEALNEMLGDKCETQSVSEVLSMK